MTVVVDNSNLEAVLADAAGESVEVSAEEPQTLTAEAAETAETEEAESAEEALPDFARELGVSKEVHERFTAIVKKEVGRQHRKLKDAEDFATEQYNERRLAEGRATRLEQELQQIKVQPVSAVAKPDEDARPKRADFATDEAHADAIVDWRVKQQLANERVEATKKAEQERIEGIRQQTIARVNAAKQTVEDWEEVVSAAHIEVPAAVGDYMQESPMVAELAYHFARHPEALEQLAAMPARTRGDIARLGIALGKLEDTLQPFGQSPKAESTNGTKPSTASEPSTTGSTPSKPRAPAPIRPLNSGSALQVEKDERDMNAREAMQAWSKKRQVNLTRRQRH